MSILSFTAAEIRVVIKDKNSVWGGPVFFGHGIGLKKLERCTRRT
jgi:hypothetical protein